MTTLLAQAIHQQQLAANPMACAWVSASAGTGKTKVLIDRLLALLVSGVNPEHILCLTFTKAAAAEMQQRLLDALQAWVFQTDDALKETLTTLLAGHTTNEQLVRARQLYTLALEAPGGLKIATIHGFCQTLLNKFPLEAGITPNPKVMDERQADDLLDQARRLTLTDVLGQDDQRIIQILVSYFKDGSFQTAIQELLDNRRYFRRVLEKYPNLDSYTTELCQKLDLPIVENLLNPNLIEDYLSQTYTLPLIDEAYLRQVAYETDHLVLASWLEADAMMRVNLFTDYAALYLTKKGELLKKQKIGCEGQANQVYLLNKRIETWQVAQKSACIFYLGCKIFQEYQRLKQQQNMLDYDDLIEKTIMLLTQPHISPWILYKLEGGIHHLLVDEAQDTNPDQWRVITALTQDFLTPQKKHRTLFVVGDVKQSIYSFQGASPRDFIAFRADYQQQCQAIGQLWYDIDLQVSFRSTPEILSVVDQVINQPDHQSAIQFHEQKSQHFPFRSHHQGRVNLLSAVLGERQSLALEPWPIPNQARRLETQLDQVCEQVSVQIQHLLDSQMLLPSTGKPIQPQDILLLVKQRGLVAPALIRTLKKQGIPVAGVDRFLLNTHLAVQDLIALGQFLLLPLDDLALACVLKSPLIELTEAELMNLAASRNGSLWQALSQRHGDHTSYQRAYDFLKKLLREVDYLSPYHLYHLILFKEQGLKKFRSRFGSEADDAVAEFLSYAFKLCEGQSIALQQFLGEIERDNQEIKRDGTDNSQNQIRLMTVHGAKGLQAPVVFIVEKFKQKSMADRLLWELDAKGEGQFVLMRPRADTDTAYTLNLKSKVGVLEAQEDKRLFYVALTRAQDHLYLTGYGDKEIPEDSWYQWLKSYASVINMPAVQGNYVRPHDVKKEEDNWLQQPVKHRKYSIKEDAPVVPQTTAMQRGIIIHRLFELLLDLPDYKREEAALTYLHNQQILIKDLPLKEILQTFQSDMFSPFCEGQAVAEMEIASPDGNLRRLDRVVVNNSVVKILDFKTSIVFPKDVALTPPAILDQLAAYAGVMQQIYPEHQIECYLLWTAGPVLHYVPETMLCLGNIKSLSSMS